MPKLKQKSTQTDTYDDLFMSDESISSNEETTINNRSSSPLSSKQVSSLVVTTNDWLFDSIDKASNTGHENNHSHQNQHNHHHSHHNHNQTTSVKNRHRPYKKTPKRRKSLPSQCSPLVVNANGVVNAIEPHTSVTLIPRGPLICSNLENLDSWLPEGLYLANNFQSLAAASAANPLNKSVNNEEVNNSINKGE